jgi:CGNR zinc finger
VPASRGAEAAVATLLVIVHEAQLTGAWSRLKACRHCTYAFFDRSKNRSAVWCSMSICGNRTKNRAYRQRRHPDDRDAAHRYPSRDDEPPAPDGGSTERAGELCPTATQGAAGRFALDDPYVEQVWAGVIGPSAVLALRRLPVLWREREPALVDLRELGQSLGLGPSLHRAGWRPPARSSQVENVLCSGSARSFTPRPFERVAPALPSRMG